MDAAFALAGSAVATTYDALPREVVEVTKLGVLDTIGVMLAASTAGEGVREIVELVREAGGKRESSVLAFGGRAPSWMAALANGAMGHPLDYDDTHDAAGVHPTTATLPAALAIAERQGKTSGRDLITALAVANDIACRLGLAVKKNPGWLLPQLMGTFGAAVAAGKLLQLNEEQMLHALALAYQQASGNLESSYQTGSVMRAIRDGFTGKTGVLSALMAQKGLTGPKSVFESKAGLYHLYFRGEYDPTPLTTNLGKHFEGVNVSFKLWPARRTTHGYIEATIGIMRENRLTTGDVAGITVIGDIQALCEPLEVRRRPAIAIDAKVSLPFTIAVAAVRGKIVIADFLPAAIHDVAVLDMAKKITYRVAPNAGKELGSGKVELETTDGRTFLKIIEFAYGHPRNPISRQDLTAKFRDCAAYSAKPLSVETVDRIIKTVDALEEVADVRRLIRLLS